MLDMQAAMLSQQLLERCSLVGGRIVQNHDQLARKWRNNSRRNMQTSSCPMLSK